MRMSDKTKKIVAIIIAVFFILIFVLPLMAPFVNAASSKSELQQDLKKTQQDKNNIKSELKQVTQQKKNVILEKQNIDNDVKDIEDKINVLNVDIVADNKNLKQIEQELIVAQLEFDKQFETYKKRLRVMYEQGTYGYANAMLSSNSFADFLNRFEIIKQIASHDKNIANKLEDKKRQIDEKKAKAEQVKKSKVEKVANLGSFKKTLGQKQKESNDLMNELKQTEDELKKTLADIERIEAQTRAELNALMKPSTSKYSGGKMSWPAPGYYTITSAYGNRLHPVLKVYKLHTGVDVGAPYGASVVAANSGTVIKAGYNTAYGNYIIIDHGGGIATLYAHASSLSVSAGQQVSRDQVIMKVGSTGYSTGAHLHFEVIVSGNTVNPMGYFN